MWGEFPKSFSYLIAISSTRWLCTFQRCFSFIYVKCIYSLVSMQLFVAMAVVLSEISIQYHQFSAYSLSCIFFKLYFLLVFHLIMYFLKIFVCLFVFNCKLFHFWDELVRPQYFRPHHFRMVTKQFCFFLFCHSTNWSMRDHDNLLWHFSFFFRKLVNLVENWKKSCWNRTDESHPLQPLHCHGWVRWRKANMQPPQIYCS